MSIDIFDELRTFRARHDVSRKHCSSGEHTVVDAQVAVIDEVITHLSKLHETGYFGDLYHTDYEVEGEYEFPHDMLRYTSSWPADEAAARAVGCDRMERRTVRLSKYHRDPEPHLAEDRWQSKFRWRVVRIIDTVKL